MKAAEALAQEVSIRNIELDKSSTKFEKQEDVNGYVQLYKTDAIIDETEIENHFKEQ